MSTEALSLPRTSRRLPIVLIAALALIPLAIFFVDPWRPLAEYDGFRQTQTAITAWWLMHGGDFFRYLTPVVGYPWTLPLEFPLYQKIVAIICGVTGLPIDFTGRLLSLISVYVACVPIVICLRKYGWAAVTLAIALFLTAPIGLFFSRTFLIEDFATMLALSALCSYVLFLRTGKTHHLWIFVVVGTIAGLQKVTTFLPVAGIVGLDTVRTQLRPLLALKWREAKLLPPVCVVLSMVLPLIWTIYSDQVKYDGVISSMLTSAALQDWNFGTLAQRLSFHNWISLLGFRITLLGGLTLAIPVIVYAASKKQLLFNRETGLFLFSGLLGPLVFFNLHVTHDYYQLSSLVFLACAVAILLAPCLEGMWTSSRVSFVGLLVAAVAANLALFYRYYSPALTMVAFPDAVAYEIARHIRGHQADDQFSVIFGQDWNSTIPYYSERYAVMVPNWVPADKRASIIANPRTVAGDKELGSIVYCLDGSRPDEEANAERTKLFSLIDGPVVELAYCQVKTRR